MQAFNHVCMLAVSCGQEIQALGYLKGMESEPIHLLYPWITTNRRQDSCICAAAAGTNNVPRRPSTDLRLQICSENYDIYVGLCKRVEPVQANLEQR